MFESFEIDSLSFHESIIHPAYADLIDTSFPFRGTLNEFTLMDNVSTKRPIVDIRRAQNIMQRRDASCDIIYKKLFGATTRSISVDEVYGATQFCRNEFYQGALKDWRNNDPLFGTKILPWFQQAMGVDMTTNGYFGDVDRVQLTTDAYNVNSYDGVFKWVKKYIDSGLIPAGQTFDIADGEDFLDAGGPAAAYALLAEMYNAQSSFMNAFTDSQKAFFVSKEIATAYEDYLIATAATAGNIQLLEDGRRNLRFKGIPVLVEELWTPVITQIKGSTGYAAVLTIRGNFVFATDKDYGEGEDGKTALEVWYEKKDMTWYYRLFLKAGTQIALPEYVIVALSSWS